MNPLDSTLNTAIGADITSPYYLIALSLSTPVYLCTIDTLVWFGITWNSASVQLSIGQKTRIQVFNENLVLGTAVLAQGIAGNAINIYQGYQNDTAHPSPVHVFSGQMGSAKVGESVDIECNKYAPLRSPRHYCTQPTFNHMPIRGTRIATPGGVVVLE